MYQYLCYNMYVLMKKVASCSPLFNIGRNYDRELIEDNLLDYGVSIDSIKYEKEGNNDFLRIVIDRDKTIDIDTVVEVTKIINPLLDDSDIFDNSYILDVSSKEKGV